MKLAIFRADRVRVEIEKLGAIEGACAPEE